MRSGVPQKAPVEVTQSRLDIVACRPLRPADQKGVFIPSRSFPGDPSHTALRFPGIPGVHLPRVYEASLGSGKKLRRRHSFSRERIAADRRAPALIPHCRMPHPVPFHNGGRYAINSHDVGHSMHCHCKSLDAVRRHGRRVLRTRRPFPIPAGISAGPRH